MICYFLNAANWLSLSGEQLFLIVILAVVASIYLLNNARKYQEYPPGPIGLPILGYLPFLGREPHKTLIKLSEKYGSKIISLKFGQQLMVVLNDYETVKEALTHPASLNRDPNLLKHLPESGFASNNGEEWKEQRKFCMQSVKDLGLGRETWQSLIQEEVRDFVKDLATFKGRPVDISSKLSLAISSNIFSILFGRRVIKDGNNSLSQLIYNYTDVALKFAGPYEPTSLVPKLKPILELFKIAGYDKAAKTISDFHKLIREEIANHKGIPEYQQLDDFINSYLGKMGEKNSTGKYFTEGNLEGNVASFFLGGSDTLFSSLAWLFPLMAQFPDVQAKVQEELDEVIGKDGTISYEERSNIPYTFAVLMEAQRFSTVVPFSGTRRAGADFKVQGYTIPKGAAITANTWAIHNDPSYWEEPEKFKPERFLENSGKKLARTPPYFMTFSIGKRNCPGEAIAWMELVAFFTSVLQKFKVSVPTGRSVKFERIFGLVCPLKPQDLCFTER